MKFMIKCFEANYPESLGSVLVYKAPWIFSGIWKIIKGWLDPVVASKVHFCSNINDLQEFIPQSQIIKELGGPEDWTYSYPEPREGEDAQMQDTGKRDEIQKQRDALVEDYEQQTVAWMNSGNGAAREKLVPQLQVNYWKLDPYIRARSLYDRIGILQAGGKLDFYPSASADAGANGGSHDDLD